MSAFITVLGWSETVTEWAWRCEITKTTKDLLRVAYGLYFLRRLTGLLMRSYSLSTRAAQMTCNSKSLVAIAALIGLLSACASSGQMALDEAMNDCKPQAGKTGLRCLRNHPKFREFPQAQQDFTVFAAMLEEQRNSGKITQAEADYAVSQYNQRQAQQAAIQSQAQSNALMSTGTTLLAIDAMNRRPATVYAPAPMMPMPTAPRIQTTQCGRNGAYVNCTTF